MSQPPAIHTAADGITTGRRWQRRPDGANWGDFGPDDQVGRMNLLTPERRLGGVREVRDGIAFTLSLPLDLPGMLSEMRKPPKLFVESVQGIPAFNCAMTMFGGTGHDVMCDDGVILYTQYSTQWDSLAHWGQRFDADDDGIAETVYYNGYRAGEHLIGPEAGGPRAAALGIENLATAGVQGRAVLVSLRQAFGPGRTWVGHDMLMQAIAAQRVEVRPGDFLVLHTGLDEAVLAMNGQPDLHVLEQTGAVLDGGDLRLLDWIDRSGIVAICSDNMAIEGVDLATPPAPDRSMLPLHELCLFKLGIHLGELWQLHELADWLLARERSAFLLTAPPLRLPGAVGSPVTPIATV
ncbi:cyclase family protein [Sphingomonas solaris]|uniref:Cyclase family protein n=1 Tax=Alterirhizorhabdus solaris TaxID=2529389 RepID=A0A558R8W7_9SPHN|nr:cyclase family protein [Sphingomonas solaris]TVV75841.1 cyclase family protein [Sphingomonas solaris]